MQVEKRKTKGVMKKSDYFLVVHDIRARRHKIGVRRRHKAREGKVISVAWHFQSIEKKFRTKK